MSPPNSLRENSLYNLHCGELFSSHLDIGQFTACYSRSNNIKDTLTKAKLAQVSGKEFRKFYSRELP